MRPVKVLVYPTKGSSVVFTPSWESLEAREMPEWFTRAKFGLWAHWGPQCQPGHGDWYARSMYLPGTEDARFHRERYGHPSRFGFKDVINEWKASRWDPEELVALYARTGARYFVAMANHHDNVDLWDSTHHAWNSVRVGPRRDIVGEWAAAARSHGLRFGVSVHAAHAWSWYEPSQGADPDGPMAGVPYDGRLSAADGAGTWWEGLDPQQLYAQNHPPAPNVADPKVIHRAWDWPDPEHWPDAAYQAAFKARTLQLAEAYRPDLVYFDDTVLPLHQCGPVGLEIAAALYTLSEDMIVCGKVLDERQRRALTWDVERGVSDRIEPEPWQTCTCLGEWHYDERVFAEHRYKPAAEVVGMLVDVVSKNGNLLLSVPVSGEGEIDEDERAILAGIGRWLAVNGEAVFDTVPWKVFGEGPSAEHPPALKAQGFNEGSTMTSADIRYTATPVGTGSSLYATVLGVPEGPVALRRLGRQTGLLDREITGVHALGEGPVSWRQEEGALVIESAAQVHRIELGLRER
ncbi:alpha-L-fucosidase [Nonomuraea phyllanthi]|uniref:alpha-L-fucosidase n=1 Tax=Nonomuraea phyllanthi TaxID=2219224 RepID=A0A5C4VDY5_9ACTN|nr:alpha-L-fucosidase [Nonomuraea phyllanthi]